MKLRKLLNENVLGELPSASMFKYNKSTGKFDAPGKHDTPSVNEAGDAFGDDSDPKAYKPKDTNPVVKQFMKDLIKHYDNNHDDLYDMKNYLHALKLMQSHVQKDYDKHSR